MAAKGDLSQGPAEVIDAALSDAAPNDAAPNDAALNDATSMLLDTGATSGGDIFVGILAGMRLTLSLLSAGRS